MNMGTGGYILGDQDNAQVSYLQKRANNDAVSRQRERRPGLGGEVMSSTLDMLTPTKRSERGSRIHKPGGEMRDLDWKYKFANTSIS